MRIDIITIFPQMFSSVFSVSMIKIAQEKGLMRIYTHNLRDYSQDKHRKVDAPPYGGEKGMVLRIEPIFRAIEAVKRFEPGIKKRKIILFSPRGRLFNQNLAKELLRFKQLILICGHYEGVDERVSRYLVDEEISLGDYILSGGEIPAMVFVDVLGRLIPGVVGDYTSVKDESFEQGLLEYPQYTRPRVFRGLKVPSILFSGNHKKIKEWRKKQALRITKQRRPDLFLKIKREEGDG